MEELTLEVLEEAIALIKTYEKQDEIIGIAIHPEDIRELENGTKRLYGIDPKRMFQIPPYQGMAIYSSPEVPRGKVIPLKRYEIKVVPQRR